VLAAGKAESLVTADVALTSILIARNELPAKAGC
jgi:hypothetical protein